jgi:glycosyltransferase involved in cell wall biosynthesis
MFQVLMPDSQSFHCVQYLQRMDEGDGGVVRFLLNFCNDLANYGHRVTLVTEDDRDVPASWTDGSKQNRSVVKLQLPGLPWSRLSPECEQAMVSVFRDADILHIHGMWDPRNLVLARFARKIHVPYVFSVHGMLNDWALNLKPWKKKLYLAIAGRTLLGRAEQIHCTAEGERMQMLKQLPRDNTTVIPLNFDREGFENLPGPERARQKFSALQTNQLVVMVLGRLHPVKRIELLIDAVALVHAAGVAVQLVVAGPPEEKRYLANLQALVSRHGLQEDVHFVGAVGGLDKVSLYQACDIFILPSWQECFGMVLAEALAAETPVITTRCVDTWPELKSAGGLIVHDTPANVAGAIVELAGDDQRRSKLGRRGRQFVFDWLDPARVIVQFDQFYRHAIDGFKQAGQK